MMEFLNFTFQSEEHFAGVAFLLMVCAWGVSGWFQVHNQQSED